MGALIFIVFVNDIPICVKFSRPLLFDDELKLFKIKLQNGYRCDFEIMH